MAVKRMDNMGIVVESLDSAIAFFSELGLTLEGRMMIEGEWAGRVTGLPDQQVEIAMMRTPDGHSRLEICRFLRPAVAADHRKAPVNAYGYLRVMFTVDDVDDTVARLRQLGATRRRIFKRRNEFRFQTQNPPRRLKAQLRHRLCLATREGIGIPSSRKYRRHEPGRLSGPTVLRKARLPSF